MQVAGSLAHMAKEKKTIRKASCQQRKKNIRKASCGQIPNLPDAWSPTRRRPAAACSRRDTSCSSWRWYRGERPAQGRGSRRVRNLGPRNYAAAGSQRQVLRSPAATNLCSQEWCWLSSETVRASSEHSSILLFKLECPTWSPWVQFESPFGLVFIPTT